MMRDELHWIAGVLTRNGHFTDATAVIDHDQAQRERIERLEARLAIAVPALQSIATPALGGKTQQYTAQHALAALAQHEQEEAR